MLRLMRIGSTRCCHVRLKGCSALLMNQTFSVMMRTQTAWNRSQKRHLTGIPSVLLPPVVFSGLVVALWTWKSFMMVIFQNKIIYMPGLPPNARRETLQDYEKQCGGIEWIEQKTLSRDGTQISLCVASVETDADPQRTVYILYFQGNTSSLPPRLPFLSPILRMLRKSSSAVKVPTRFTMVCCSYRGYWKSKGRPSERGIQLDAQAALDWIDADANNHQILDKSHISSVVVWGQSIGAGFATQLVATSSSRSNDIAISTLILETPFLSVRSMLTTLYPQKWLPYRYLSPFLWNHLDIPKALDHIPKSGRKPLTVLIIDAQKDELVPQTHADEIESQCLQLHLITKRYTLQSALHNEVVMRPEGQKRIVETIRES